MSSPLAIQIMRFGFLILLWLFVYGAVRVVRSDLRTAGQNRVALPPPTRRRRRDAQAAGRAARARPTSWSPKAAWPEPGCRSPVRPC